MVDAILLRRAIEKGIDPVAANAPQSVVEAVKEFQLLRGATSGILAEVDNPNYLREFAEENLVIGVTAANEATAKPCFTFIDAGEGQQPDDFERTFLSLSSGRKKDIPFVQGKYNMGFLRSSFLLRTLLVQTDNLATIWVLVAVGLDVSSQTAR